MCFAAYSACGNVRYVCNNGLWRSYKSENCHAGNREQERNARLCQSLDTQAPNRNCNMRQASENTDGSCGETDVKKEELLAIEFEP